MFNFFQLFEVVAKMAQEFRYVVGVDGLSWLAFECMLT